MQRILQFAVLIAMVIVGGVLFLHWSRNHAMNSGEVHVRQQPAEAAKSAVPEGGSANPAAQQGDQSANPEVAQNDQNRSQSQSSVYTLPASETLSRNPPDRTVLAGSGRYELYRQGDITWRMDTATGQACVLFATEAMWRRSLVYEHGCGAGTPAR
jgi:hypothetical protein